MSNQDDKRLKLLHSLADELDIDINYSQPIINANVKNTRIGTRDGSLEAELLNTESGNEIDIKSLEAPGITIKLVDTTKNPLAPEGAIYEISSYMVGKSGHEYALDNDVRSVYVGKNGIIIDDSGRERISKLLEK